MDLMAYGIIFKKMSSLFQRKERTIRHIERICIGYTQITTGTFTEGTVYAKRNSYTVSWTTITAGTDYTVGNTVEAWLAANPGSMLATYDAAASVVTIERQDEPDGTPYNFHGFEILAKLSPCPDMTAANAGVGAYARNYLLGETGQTFLFSYSAGISKTDSKWGGFRIRRERGKLYHEILNPMTASNWSQSWYTTYDWLRQNFIVSDSLTFKRASITTSSSGTGVYLKADSELDIYAY